MSSVSNRALGKTSAEPPWKHPAPWLAAVPLMAVVLAFTWGVGALSHPGMQPGRGVAALLIVGCVLALSLPGRLRWSWQSPLPYLGVVVLLHAVVLWFLAPVREPGILWWGERAGALLTAVGIAAWCRGRDASSVLIGLAWAGAGMLACEVLTRGAYALVFPSGPSLPFGNSNFNVGGGLPLMGIAFLGLTQRRFAVPLIVGGVAALMIGIGDVLLRLIPDDQTKLREWLAWSGIVHDDVTKAVWVTLPAMFGMWLLLRLPARVHGWVVGLGVIGLISGFIALLSGWLSLSHIGNTTGYRLALWRTAVDAMSQHPWIGSGPASTIVTLQEQSSSATAWMWVPSYAEHAHNEYLQAFLDGGVLGASLLLAALIATLLPVWRRRHEAPCAALLIAWTGVLANALVESHLSQPGPLVLLAMLVGVTWAITQPTQDGNLRIPVRPVASVAIAALIFAQCSREFSDGGSPSMIEHRTKLRMSAAKDDHAQVAAIVADMRNRLGDLDTWLTVECVARIRAKQFAEAERLAVAQVSRLPVDPAAADLLTRLRDRRAKAGEVTEAEALNLALAQARERAQVIMAAVPENPKNQKARDMLKKAYGF